MAETTQPSGSSVGFFVGLGMVVVALALGWFVFGDDIREFVSNIGNRDEVAEATPTPGTYVDPFDFDEDEATRASELDEATDEDSEAEEIATGSAGMVHTVSEVDAGIEDVPFGALAMVLAAGTIFFGMMSAATEKTYWLDR